MIKKTRKIIFLFLTFFLFLNFFSNAYSDSNYKIIALVDEKPITNYDLSKEIGYMNIISLGNIGEYNDENINKIALESLIKKNLKEKEVNKNNITINEGMAEIEMNALLEKISLGDLDKVNQLIEGGIFKKKDLLEKISIELKWNLLIASLFQNKVIINEEEIKEKIQKISKNQKINEYLVSEIFIDSENNIELKKKLEKILISINQIGFENTAIQFSGSPSSQEGGKLGWLSEDQISEKLLEEINKIEPGMISKPIPTSNGLLLLKVHEKKTSKKEMDIKQNLQKLITIEKNKIREEDMKWRLILKFQQAI